MSRQRKPLVERVLWSPLDPGWSYEAVHGPFKLTLEKNCPHEWYIGCADLGVSEAFAATSVPAAKAEALRIVQAAVMQAFDEWRD